MRTIVTMDGDGRLAIDLRHQGEGIGAMLAEGRRGISLTSIPQAGRGRARRLPLICRFVGIGV